MGWIANRGRTRGPGHTGRRRPGGGVVVAAVTSVLLGAMGVAADPARAAEGEYCGGLQGPYQQQAERFLGRAADGRQSQGDCRAVRSFQQTHGIHPQYGYAGPVTWGVMQVVAEQQAAAPDPDRTGRCPVNQGRIACVDLTRQISWIQDGAKLVKGPVPVRTGRDRHETVTGLHRITWRHRDHVSTIYDVPMPYSQFFHGGEAFHAIDGSMWSQPGSHGCVNMRPADAESYWSLLREGNAVYVYGTKQGTRHVGTDWR